MEFRVKSENTDNAFPGDESDSSVNTSEKQPSLNLEPSKQASEVANAGTSNDFSPARMYVKRELKTGVMRMVFDQDIVAKIKREPQTTENTQFESALKCEPFPSNANFKQETDEEDADQMHLNRDGETLNAKLSVAKEEILQLVETFTSSPDISLLEHASTDTVYSASGSTHKGVSTDYDEQLKASNVLSAPQETESETSGNSDVVEEDGVYPTGLFVNEHAYDTLHSEVMPGTGKKRRGRKPTVGRDLYGNKVYKCSQCHATYTSCEALKVHRRKHTGERPYKCSQCHAAFSSLSSLYTHNKTHSGEKPYQCAECPAAFAFKSRLKDHARTHSAERTYVCSECMATFAQPACLKIHRRIHSGETPYHCTECSASFTQSSNLKIHMRSHTGERPYKCSVCSAAFVVVSRLKVHMRSHTGEKPFQCSMCLAAFSQAGELKMHTRIHTGEKYQCPECSSAFTQKGYLQIHMRTHTGEKPFKCSKCTASFVRADGLKNHTRTHSYEKPFQCIECAASFTHRSTLAVHMRTHSGEKPYQCSLCYLAFSQASHLKTHMKIHSGGDHKPAKCAHCPAAFTCQRILNAHIKKCHSKDKSSLHSDEGETDISIHIVETPTPHNSGDGMQEKLST